MELISKIILNREINSKTSYFSSIVLSDYESLLIKTNKLKEILEILSKTRKKNQTQEREELIKRINKILEHIELNYGDYIANLGDLKRVLKYNKDVKLSNKTQKQIKIALESKSKIINEFETIYKNFKNMAKNMPEHMPIKEVLANMRESFDFVSKETNICHQYYDSTSMTIRMY